MGKPIEEWGPTCARCGHEEYRVDGYCSIYCRDMAEVEEERDELQLMADRVPELTQALEGMIEMIDYLFEKVNWGGSWLDAKAIRLLNEKPIIAHRVLAKFIKKEEK